MDEKQILQALKESIITPGTYMPSRDVKNGMHYAVYVNGEPFVLTGHTDDKVAELSFRQARALSESKDFKMLIENLGIKNPEIATGVLDGRAYEWGILTDAVVKSERGVTETGGDGELIWIVLQNDKRLVTGMCISKEIQAIVEERS